MSSRQILSGLDGGWLGRSAKIRREGRPWWLPASEVRDFEWAAAAMRGPSTAPAWDEHRDELAPLRAPAVSTGTVTQRATRPASRVARTVYRLPRWLVRSLQLAGGLTAGVLLALVAL